MINGICHRVRTGVPWRDLPPEFGEWITVYKRFRRWSADGTWERLLQVVRAQADAAGDIDWRVSVDSTIERAHQHAAGAPHRPPPAPPERGTTPGRTRTTRHGKSWSVATRFDKRGYLFTGTITIAVLLIWLRT